MPRAMNSTTTKAIGAAAAGTAGFYVIRTLRKRSSGSPAADNRWGP